MTLFDLLKHRMQASSGNEATFDIAFMSPVPGEPASRVTVVTCWNYPPSAADIAEARALMCTISDFKYLASGDNIRSAMHFHSTGRIADPAMN